MNEIETRANAMIAELVAQRNSALDRCAALAGELAQALEKLKQDKPPAEAAK